MDDLARLRDQLAGLGGRPNGQPGGSRDSLPANSISPANSAVMGNRASRAAGQQQGQGGQPGQSGQQGKGASKAKLGKRDSRDKAAKVDKSATAPRVRPAIAGGGGNRGSTVYGDYDTGNTRISGRAAAPQQGPNPADTQREIEQGLDLLNGVRSVGAG